MPDGTPASESAYTSAQWAGDSGRRWAAKADTMDAQFEPVNTVLFAAASLEPGERVLDVGCGHGATTRLAAAQVARDGGGSVTGVDVSTALLEAAAERTPVDAPIEWMLADAQTAELPTDLDIVISRFGVMFFSDPIAAFTNLRSALRPGGRLCTIVWPTRERIPLLHDPLVLALATAREAGFEPDVPSADAGPFSLGRPDVARAVLGEAGWVDIEIVEHELVVYSGGPGTVDEITRTTMETGPIRTAFEGAPTDVVNSVTAAIRADIEAHHDGVGRPLPTLVTNLRARQTG